MPIKLKAVIREAKAIKKDKHGNPKEYTYGEIRIASSKLREGIGRKVDVDVYYEE